MKQEFVIMDASVKFMNARNPLEEGLLYDGTNWVHGLNKACKFDNASLTIQKAQELQKEAPVRVFMLQINGNNINLTEIKF